MLNKAIYKIVFMDRDKFASWAMGYVHKRVKLVNIKRGAINSMIVDDLPKFIFYKKHLLFKEYRPIKMFSAKNPINMVLRFFHRVNYQYRAARTDVSWCGRYLRKRKTKTTQEQRDAETFLDAVIKNSARERKDRLAKIDEQHREAIQSIIREIQFSEDLDQEAARRDGALLLKRSGIDLRNTGTL